MPSQGAAPPLPVNDPDYLTVSLPADVAEGQMLQVQHAGNMVSTIAGTRGIALLGGL